MKDHLSSRGTKSTPKPKGTTTTRRKKSRPCIFRTAFVREQVDPRVQVEWTAFTGHPAPFGDLRQTFKREHCSQVNPHADPQCAYREEECAMAFLGAVQSVLVPGVRNPAAMFRSVARRTGLERADNKPLAREMHHGVETNPFAALIHQAQAAAQPAPGRLAHTNAIGDATGLEANRMAGTTGRPQRGVSVLDPADTDLRRARHRPESIGDLLGALNARPHQTGPENGSEGR